MTDDRECGKDVAAYALEALDEAEAEAFRLHLESCVVCRDELAAFRQVVEALPMGTPTYAAPPGLRRRVLRAVAAEPRRAPSGRPRRRRPLLRLAPAAGAAFALAVAAVVVVLALGSSSPSTRVVTAKVTGRGTAALHLTRGHAELVVHRFPAPPAGQIYEVWLQRGGVAHPTTALFGVNRRGDADVGVPGSLHGVSKVMVTREPAGGTQTPTHPPVISAALE